MSTLNNIEQKQPFRVLVFGTTGTGKTSLCNALTGEEQEVSNSAQGVTLDSYTYKVVPFCEEKSLIITDTVGLNESDRGRISSQDAVKKLIKLLRNSEAGYNLLIHVFRIPRITQAEENNYQFFVRIIAESRIPTILVATGCEDIDPMSKWKDENQDIFKQRELEYKEIICTSFARSERALIQNIYEGLKNQSKEVVLAAIKSHATEEPVKLYTNQNGLIIIFKRTWNWLADWLKLYDLKFNVIKTLKELLIQIGFKEEDIKTFLKDFNIHL